MVDEATVEEAAGRRLEVAIGFALLEVVVQTVVLIGRGAWSVAPLRIAFLVAKVPFCLLALRRRPGAFMGVWLWEFGGVVAAISVRGSLGPRVATAALALVVMTLLGRAVSAFPPVEWRAR